jgi:NAD(P)H dehydrogenase (quinone)
MKIIVILAHPKKLSFNHAIAANVVRILRQNGHEVVFHDLYDEKFDPLVTPEEISKIGKVDGRILEYCDELKSSGGIVFVHPNWWGQPPAILKGYIDRVLRPGAAYKFEEGDNGEGIPKGLLSGIKALVLNTTDTGAERETEVFGDPLDNIWKKCIFEFCGINDYVRKTYGIIVTSTPEQRAAWLEDAGALAGSRFPADK